MNVKPNAIAESSVASPSAVAADVPAARLLVWSIRRELWENWSIYVAPLAVAGLVLFGFLIRLIGFPARMRALSALDVAHQRDAIQGPNIMVAGLLMVTGMLVGAFYSLDALYGERKDRSTLFWKSLPVSDVVTVASKASIPIFLLQLLVAAIIVVTQTIMLMASSAVLLGSGQSASTVSTHVPWVQMSLMMFYHLIVLHGLWHAPFYAWLLMVSSWARRTPFLWAVLPAIAIGMVEKVAFNTRYFGDMLIYQLTGGSGIGASRDMAPLDMLGHFEPGRELGTPGLWIGLAVTALFLFVATRLRRQRGPI